MPAIIHPSYLINLDTFAQLRGLATGGTDDNTLRHCLKRASAWFEENTQRSFMPYQRVKSYDALGDHVSYYRLDTDDDLLDIVTLTNGDDTAIAASAYVLRPNNLYPKYRIQLKQSSGVNFQYVDDWENALSVNGVWGYHENYAQAWKNTDALAAALNASATLAVIASPNSADIYGNTPHIGTLSTLKIDSEMLLVTAISGATLTVQRGANGTTAGTHAEAANVQTYRQLGDVERAVSFLAGYYYDVKDVSGTGIQILDFAMKVDRTIAEEISDTTQRYRWSEMKPL